MAQWIPKTAWKVSNLNKRYGPQHIASSTYKGVQDVEPLLSAYSSALAPQNASDAVRQRIREVMMASSSSNSNSMVIDIRDLAARKHRPLETAAAVHPLDILSGAALPILPAHKEDSEIFMIVSSGEQHRGINAAAALRRWGYHRVVHAVDEDVLAAVATEAS